MEAVHRKKSLAGASWQNRVSLGGLQQPLGNPWKNGCAQSREFASPRKKDPEQQAVRETHCSYSRSLGPLPSVVYERMG
eukprot:1000098-Amphidinium_carterae.1